MSEYEILSLYYQRCMLNSMIGRVETKAETVKAVRFGVAQVRKMITSGAVGVVESAVEDYDKESGA